MGNYLYMCPYLKYDFFCYLLWVFWAFALSIHSRGHHWHMIQTELVESLKFLFSKLLTSNSLTLLRNIWSSECVIGTLRRKTFWIFMIRWPLSKHIGKEDSWTSLAPSHKSPSWYFMAFGKMWKNKHILSNIICFRYTLF
jgi:hypothetical protein